MKLLVSHNEFQKDVREIRKHLNLPVMGFSDADSQEKIAKWHQNIESETGRVWSSKEFVEQELKIKNDLREGKIRRSMANRQLGLLSEKAPSNYLNNRVFFLICKFNLPLNFEYYIKLYIVGGTIGAPQHNYIGGMYPVMPVNSKKEQYLNVKIYTKLTKDEMDELHAYIEWIGHRLPKYNPIKDIDKKLEVEEWYENPVRVDEADGFREYTMPVSEIAENLLGSPKKVKKVYDIVDDLKKMKNKMFGNSENTTP